MDQCKMGRQEEKCVNRFAGWTNNQQIQFSVRNPSGYECGKRKDTNRM